MVAVAFTAEVDLDGRKLSALQPFARSPRGWQSRKAAALQIILAPGAQATGRRPRLAQE